MFCCLERIVMTPKKKTAHSTSLAMERKRLQPGGDKARKTSLHVAGARTSLWYYITTGDFTD